LATLAAVSPAGSAVRSNWIYAELVPPTARYTDDPKFVALYALLTCASLTTGSVCADSEAAAQNPAQQARISLEFGLCEILVTVFRY
jgi:hypothetical protein